MSQITNGRINVAVDTPCEERCHEAHSVINHVEAMHREIGNRKIRELELLVDEILASGGCCCNELDNVLGRFERLRNALLPWLIREQYLLLPAIKQKMLETTDGTAVQEAYDGEYADIARNAAADHNFLRMLSEELDREMTRLTSKGICPPSVCRFAHAVGQFSAYLRAEFSVEDNELLPCFNRSQAGQ